VRSSPIPILLVATTRTLNALTRSLISKYENTYMKSKECIKFLETEYASEKAKLIEIGIV
jgi:hypothetical protein